MAGRRALPDHLRRLVEQQGKSAARKPAKYHSRQVEDPVDHVLYDSAIEAEVAAALGLEELAGQISKWSWAPRYVLQRDPNTPGTIITYRPDFIVWPADGREWYALDAKGIRTQAFNLRVRLWKVRLPRHRLILVERDPETHALRRRPA